MLKHNSFVLLSVFAITLELVNGQVIFERSCPLRSIIFDFNLTEVSNKFCIEHFQCFCIRW
jgi:hypothetical protein